jgi:hypothetical protein
VASAPASSRLDTNHQNQVRISSSDNLIRGGQR